MTHLLLLIHLSGDFWGKGLEFLLESPALFKVLLFFLVWVGLWLPIAAPLALILKWTPSKPLLPSQKLPLLASLYLLAPLVVWGAALPEHRTFADFGLPWSISLSTSLGLGLLLGVLGLGVMFGIEWALGWARWQAKWQASSSDAAGQLSSSFSPSLTPLENSSPAPITTLLSTLLLGLWVGLTEELIFRGFLQNQLQQDYGRWVAAAVASLIFALLHLVWEGRENIPQIPGLWLMGMVLSLARWVDGDQLGLAWGLHAGWIWTIASLDTMQAIAYTERGSSWLVGVSGKPLAGVIGLLFLLATGGVLWGLQVALG